MSVKIIETTRKLFQPVLDIVSAASVTPKEKEKVEKERTVSQKEWLLVAHGAAVLGVSALKTEQCAQMLLSVLSNAKVSFIASFLLHFESCKNV